MTVVVVCDDIRDDMPDRISLGNKRNEKKRIRISASNQTKNSDTITIDVSEPIN